MKNTDTKHFEAVNALKNIIPLLESHSFKWVITGGFACYVYGVDRDITDIDIDIDTSKDESQFQSFVNALEPYITQPLENYVDQNYNNYNFEATFDELIVDICPMAELKIFNKEIGSYELCYNNGFPPFEVVSFNGMNLPLLSKTEIIKDKEKLVWQRESDHRDIAGLKQLLKADNTSRYL